MKEEEERPREGRKKTLINEKRKERRVEFMVEDGQEEKVNGEEGRKR